jgi:hypothetical protein
VATTLHVPWEEQLAVPELHSSAFGKWLGMGSEAAASAGKEEDEEEETWGDEEAEPGNAERTSSRVLSAQPEADRLS